MFVIEIILSSQFAWFSVISSSNLSLKHVYMNFPKLNIVCCVFRYVRTEPLCIILQLLKSTDLINLENAFEYFAVNSLLVVSHVPPLDFIWCFKVFLCNSSILQSYIKNSDDCAPSSRGHIGLSTNLNLWRYEATCMAMNKGSVSLDETYEGYFEGYCEGSSSFMEIEFLYCEQRFSSSILYWNRSSDVTVSVWFKDPVRTAQ